MAESTEKTINKHIRVLPVQCERSEGAVQSAALTANQIVANLAIETLGRRELPNCIPASIRPRGGQEAEVSSALPRRFECT